MRRALLLVFIVAGCQSGEHESPDEARLVAHFDEVIAELESADLGTLDPAQRAARADNIDRLRAYRDRRQFPHNHDFAQRTPYFVDDHGTRCAMAYLIDESGGGELVDRVAATANNAYVPELAGDPELVAWLDANGLTAAEAARIQPTYSCENFPDRPDCDDERNITTAYVAAAGTSIALSGLTIGLNLDRDAGNGVGALGLLTGVAGLAIGYPGTTGIHHRVEKTLGWISMGTGAVAILMGLRTLLTDPPPDPDAAKPVPTGPPGWTVAPMAGPEGAGLAVTGRF